MTPEIPPEIPKDEKPVSQQTREEIEATLDEQVPNSFAKPKERIPSRGHLTLVKNEEEDESLQADLGKGDDGERDGLERDGLERDGLVVGDETAAE